MIDLAALQNKFPHHKVISQPAEGCGCKGAGFRYNQKLGREVCCICVCLSPPKDGQPDYRVEIGKALGQAARNALGEIAAAKGGAL